MKNILISTGGSGGHIFPAIALYDHFKDSSKVYISTDKRGSRFLEEYSLKFEIIDVPNLLSNVLKLPINFFQFTKCIYKSFNFLKKNKIDILISTGGYMSIPICIASIFLDIKIFLFEPNMVIGRANNFALKFSKKIICYDKSIKGFSKKYQNKIYIIPPVLRKELYIINKNNINKIEDNIKIIVIGGSQGAKFFDNIIPKLILKISSDCKIEICQQVYDENKTSELKKIYNDNNVNFELFRYDKDLFKKLSKYDLAITRSGASAISELAQANVPFIAVPFPFAQDNHQFLNAKYYRDKNCCWLVNQNEFEIEKMSIFIKNLIIKKDDYFEKRKNLKDATYQNTWNNINQKLLRLINDN